MSTEQQIEQAIQAAGADAPRVKPEDLDAEIAASDVRYFTALEGVIGWQLMNNPTGQGHIGGIENGESLGLITICCIVLPSGFKLIGTSAPVSASNFRANVGKEAAFNNARNQLWPLLGFRLADKLHWQKKADSAAWADEMQVHKHPDGTEHVVDVAPPMECSVAAVVSALPEFSNIEVPLILDIVRATLAHVGLIAVPVIQGMICPPYPPRAASLQESYDHEVMRIGLKPSAADAMTGHDHVKGFGKTADHVARAYPFPADCPHAAPFRYCEVCKADPCPIGLAGNAKKDTTP